MASKLQLVDLDFNSVSRILNIPDGTLDQHPATFKQLKQAIENTKPKDTVRVATSANINIASAPATIDGVTMVLNDRVLLRNQSSNIQNGIYIFNGTGNAMTRSLDFNLALEIINALVFVAEGTDTGSTWRQSASVATIGVDPIIFLPFGVSVPNASEVIAGILEIATQLEVDTGTDDVRAITPLKLANWVGRAKKASFTLGDGSATQYDLSHNFNTEDVMCVIYNAGGVKDDVGFAMERISLNVVRIKFSSAPALNSLKGFVIG